MWINPTTPNLADYSAFIASVAGIPEVNLPPDLVGTGSLAAGSNVLTIASVTSGALYVNAQIFDAASSIPLWTSIAAFQSGTGGIGTYQMSGVASTTQAESISAYNSQLVMTLTIAQQLVNQQLAQVASPLFPFFGATPLFSAQSISVYPLACYNLAADRLINYAIDIPGQSLFKDARTTFNIMAPIMGVVSSSGDQGTNMSYLNPEQMKMFTLQDLQTLKTPYGRTYMGMAQSVGTLWGMS